MSEDVDLLEAWRAGDHAAGEQLLLVHYDCVLRFFRTKAGDDADDLVQRTFLRCVDPKVSFAGRSSFRAFLFGVARNVLYEHLRALAKRRKVDPDFGVSAVVDLEPRASTVAFAKAEKRQLVLALQRLPVDIQMTLELHYWEEMSVDEVGEALDIPPGTVKSRLHRGRTLLRELIESAPDDAGLSSVRVQLERWISDVRSLRPPGAPE